MVAHFQVESSPASGGGLGFAGSSSPSPRARHDEKEDVEKKCGEKEEEVKSKSLQSV